MQLTRILIKIEYHAVLFKKLQKSIRHYQPRDLHLGMGG